MDNRSFEELEIYKTSVLLRKDIFNLVKRFPKEEKYRLTDQLIRSTRKCPANIAEGHGRYHYQEFIQYCRIARGSLSETIDHLRVALECEYINEEEFTNLKSRIERNMKMINGFIKFLNKQKILKK